MAGEEAPGVTPMTVELERGETPVQIVVKADGMADKAETVVPIENRVLVLVLTAVEAPDKSDKDGKDGDRASDRSDSDRKDRERRRRRSHDRDRDKNEKERGDKGEKGEGRTTIGDDILRPEL